MPSSAQQPCQALGASVPTSSQGTRAWHPGGLLQLRPPLLGDGRTFLCKAGARLMPTLGAPQRRPLLPPGITASVGGLPVAHAEEGGGAVRGEAQGEDGPPWGPRRAADLPCDWSCHLHMCVLLPHVTCTCVCWAGCPELVPGAPRMADPVRPRGCACGFDRPVTPPRGPVVRTPPATVCMTQAMRVGMDGDGAASPRAHLAGRNWVA